MQRLLRHLAVLGLLAMCSDCYAQVNDPKAVFEAFRKQAQQNYSNFRQQCLENYADFVRKAWDAFEGKAPIPAPKDEMLPPVTVPKEELETPKAEPKPVVIDQVVKTQPVLPQPEPIEPVKENPDIQEETVAFTFFGTKAKVRYDSSRRILLHSADNNAVADAMMQLGDGRCDNTLYDCLKLRTDYNLCDWAYLMMLKQLTSGICGQNSNEGTLLMAYLYMQSGYRMRLAESGGRLYMMYASDSYIYDQVGYSIDGQYYFGVGDLPDRLNICRAAYPKERTLSLLINKVPRLDSDMTEERERIATHYSNVRVKTSVNRNWLDFCSTYPTSTMDDNIVSRWAMYANTPLASEVKEQLYPQLESLISGKSQLNAANLLLNWVQTGFEYEFDDKVWGRDRAFFAEETLYYPYCDCEDRSILFTRLVRDLLGLKCLLVFYPGHLATAVCFTESVKGDYILLNGQRYIVSDPTYIDAPVGMTMPNMDNQTAKVILLE